ncbi:4'-phosphopantetheinyl transferase superfamily protein [Streptomyces nitrosporeus]|uniref:4'-phosphopantetheinyl transferase family protein n=1 Tax=Streptomyces nitrosporeus TaxID=28894 RepID=UPI0039A295CB
MIEEMLDRPVVGIDDLQDAAGSTLFPEEEIVSSSMSRERRLKFAAVRGCARQGLRELGISAGPILRGPGGEPVWPAGVVGSMTHCPGYHAAAVARSDEVAAIGIDAEVNGPLRHREMISLITTVEERTWISDLEASHPEVSWARLVFSAKESLFKAWFSFTGERLGLGDISIGTKESPDGEFTARVFARRKGRCVPRPSRLTGRWMARDGLLVTATTIPRPSHGEDGRRAARTGR